MRLVLSVLPLTALACWFVGCGGAPQGSPDAANSTAGRDAARTAAPASSADTTAAADASGPAGAVAQFYEALRRGNDAAIASLLTDKAREETSKSGLGIQSQASASLAYEIGETDYVTDQMDGAHVKTTWKEAAANGQMTSTQVVWVLRKQANGWKISGMATPVVEGELPLLFNFEQPEDMLQKKAFVEQQLAQPDTAAEPASGPQATTAEVPPTADATGTR